MTKPANQAKSAPDKKAKKALGDSKRAANRPTKNQAESAPSKQAREGRTGSKHKQQTSVKRGANKGDRNTAQAKRKGTAKGSEPAAKRAAREGPTSTDSSVVRTASRMPWKRSPSVKSEDAGHTLATSERGRPMTI